MMVGRQGKEEVLASKTKTIGCPRRKVVFVTPNFQHGSTVTSLMLE
jgi:hypothetical protein